MERLLQERIRARAEKNYSLADKIRDSLRDMGIYLKDTREGTFWYVE